MMKKSFVRILLMFTLALGFVSCSNDETETTDNILAENIQKFGTRSSEVNLYFGSNKIASTHQTRSCDVNANMWGDIIPDYPTQDEVNGVLAHVQNGGQEVEWPGYTYYFVQHVTGAHHKYSYTDRNNYTHSDIDGTAHLDYFKIEENRELKSWEIDPNTGKPYSWVDLYTGAPAKPCV
jgi:hypothetical protein